MASPHGLPRRQQFETSDQDVRHRQGTGASRIVKYFRSGRFAFKHGDERTASIAIKPYVAQMGNNGPHDGCKGKSAAFSTSHYFDLPRGYFTIAKCILLDQLHTPDLRRAELSPSAGAAAGESWGGWAYSAASSLERHLQRGEFTHQYHQR